MDVKLIDNSAAVIKEKDIKMLELLQEFADEALDKTQASTPVQTGNLRDSFDTVVSDKEAYIGSDCEYAIPIEIGTMAIKPHNMLRNGCIAAKSVLKNSYK